MNPFDQAILVEQSLVSNGGKTDLLSVLSPHTDGIAKQPSSCKHSLQKATNLVQGSVHLP